MSVTVVLPPRDPQTEPDTRTLRVPSPEVAAEVPPIDERAGMLWLWNGSGDPDVLDPDTLAGATGPAGPAGPTGAAGGDYVSLLHSEIATTTVSASIDRLYVLGRTALGDRGDGWMERRTANATGTTVSLACDTQSADGAYWRWAKQPLKPEMFGAVADGVTDCYPSFMQMYALANYRAKDVCFHLAGGGEYRINQIFSFVSGFTTYTITREDGRTASGSFFTPTDGNATMGLIGVKGLLIIGGGAKITCNGNFNLTAADYNGTVPIKNSMIPLHFWKCEDVNVYNLRFNGEWSRMTAEQGGGGQRFGYAVRAVASKRMRFYGCEWTDFSMDAVVCTHRYASTLGGVALSDLEAYPEPDATTSSVWYPSGLNQDWRFYDCFISNCGRQGCSPVGVWDFLWVGGRIESVYVNPSTLPRWLAGDPTGPGNSYQVPPVLPGYCIDFEPDRNGVDQCKNLRFVSCYFGNSLGWMGALGDAGSIRVQNAFLSSNVSVANDTITFASTCTLPRVVSGITPQRIRFFPATGGSLPGGISQFTDYYIGKTSTTVIKVATSPANALAGIWIDITSQGSGTCYAALYDSLPCINRIEFDNCDFHHPWWGGLAPLTGHVPLYRFRNCTFDIEGGISTLKISGNQCRSEVVFDGGKIAGVGQVLISPASQELVTLAQATDIDMATDTFTDVAFSPDSATDGLGRYEYAPVRVSSSVTLPTPLSAARRYFLTRLTADTFKLSNSEADAMAGTYIDITALGSGTMKMSRDYGHTMQFKGVEFVGKARNPFKVMNAALDVNPATDTIYCPDHKLSGPCFSGATLSSGTPEPVRVVAIGSGTLPGGITAASGSGSSNYYVIVVDKDNFKLATSTANANANTPIDITAVGTGLFRLCKEFNVYNFFDVDAFVPHTMRDCSVFIPKEWHRGTGTENILTMLRWKQLENVTFDTDLPAGSGATWQITHDNTDEFALKSGLRVRGPQWTTTGLAALSGAYQRTLTVSTSLTPASVNANTLAEQTFTVAGLATTDRVSINSAPGATYGLSIERVRVSATDTLAISWANSTAGSLTPTSGSYGVTVLRSVN